MTGEIISAMPDRTEVYLYGALSEAACGGINPLDIIFHGKSLRGFFLGDWVRRRGPLRVLRATRQIQRMIVEGRIATKFQRRLTLDEAAEGLLQYVAHMTDGKVLLTFE
jgi:NADPH:quinone reductase-like Zn-dependent oxidoreductase